MLLPGGALPPIGTFQCVKMPVWISTHALLASLLPGCLYLPSLPISSMTFSPSPAFFFEVPTLFPGRPGTSGSIWGAQSAAGETPVPDWHSPGDQPKYFSLSSVLKQPSLLRKWVLGCEQQSGPRSTLLWRGSLSQSAKLTSVTRNWICSLPWFLRQGPIYSNFWHMGGTYMVFALITTTGWPERKF